MSQYAHPEILVNTQWLVDHLNDPNLRLIEVDMSPEPYQNAHIPGLYFGASQQICPYLMGG